ncbi:MAG: hypothetical protein HKN42_00240 [Granulosicoccus sp.]|nr:hypothetical protein [Granulosicoccus sp.]
MITTTDGCRASGAISLRRKFRRGLPRLCVLAVLGMPLAACTNSKIILGPLYNQMDDQIRSEIIELGEFTDAQLMAFDQAVGTYHVWHRQSELPRYAGLLQEIADKVATSGNIGPDQVERWVKDAEELARAARECHPLNFLVDTMRTLSDDQLNVIEQRYTAERSEHRERHASRTPEQRVERRLKNLQKWAGRMNVQLNPAQLAALGSTLRQQTSLSSQYYTLADAWTREVFRIARDQSASEYTTRMREHMNARWTLLESAYPAQWQANRRLWQKTLHALILSLSEEQRRNFSQWSSKMSDTVLAISRDEPSFQIGNDPGIGCLPDTSS